MDTLKAVIVEDEKASRETLKSYLEKYCEGVKVQALCEDIREGLVAIEKYEPDVVFLDVEMPYGNAFDLLEQVKKVTFETIFVTAFSHYAMQALNFSAAYYILKPVDIDELVSAVDKVRKNRLENRHAMHTQVLVDNMKVANKQLKQLVLPTMEGFEVIQVQDVIRCEANDNFTNFHLTNGNVKMICRTLKFYDEILSDYDFMRVHKSHMINLQYVKAYKRGKGGTVVMNDDSVVYVSPSKKEDFMARF